MFEISIPQVPSVEFDVVTPNREYDFFVQEQAVIMFEVSAGVADSGVDLSLIYQIGLL